ncbi:MAG: hypothetical protein ISN28_14215 [Ectothiorhodospiraceae bacterium AqS1]|nr:hypothetical protein [Ectothiorhodospiraceae bacterium AqS1]
MNSMLTMMPAFSEDGDFIVEVQDLYWRVVKTPPNDEFNLPSNTTYLLSDYVHACILADIHNKITNLPTRVNAYKECYIHFKSHHLAPDIWYLYRPKKGAFKNLQSAIEGCDDLIRTGHITEARISFTQDTKAPGCYYLQGQAGSVQVQFGEGADDGKGIKADGDHPA